MPVEALVLEPHCTGFKSGGAGYRALREFADPACLSRFLFYALHCVAFAVMSEWCHLVSRAFVIVALLIAGMRAVNPILAGTGRDYSIAARALALPNVVRVSK